MENLEKNVNFITRKISSPLFSSLNSLSVDMLLSHLCVHHPETQILFSTTGVQGWCIHTQFSHLSRQRQWLLKNELQELLPSVHPSFELPFPILSTYLGDNFVGMIQKVSDRALCWRAEHWYCNSFWDRPSNVVYWNLGVENSSFYLCGLPEILLKFPRSQCFLQLDHRHWKKYSKGYIEAQWHLLWL